MRTLLLIALLLVIPAAPAFAGENANNSDTTINNITNQGGRGGEGGSVLVLPGAVRGGDAIQGQNQRQDQTQVQGQQQGQRQNTDVRNTNNNVNLNAPDNSNRNVNVNTYDGYAGAVGVGYVGIESPRPLPGNPDTVPFQLPMIQPGLPHDATALFPALKGLRPLVNETVVDVLKVYDGNVFARIRLQDVYDTLKEAVQDAKSKADKTWKNVRYRVYSRLSASSAGIGGSVTGGGDAVTGQGTGGYAGASILPGVARSTSDPRFTVILYAVE